MRKLSKINEGLWDGIVDRGTTGKKRKEDCNISSMKWIEEDGLLWADRDLVLDGENEFDIWKACPDIPKGYRLPTMREMENLLNLHFDRLNSVKRKDCPDEHSITSKTGNLVFEAQADEQHMKSTGWFVSTGSMNRYFRLSESASRVNFLMDFPYMPGKNDWSEVTKLRIRLVKDVIDESLWDDMVRRDIKGEVRKEN